MEFDSQEAFEKSGADFEEDFVALIDPASHRDDAVWKLSLQKSKRTAVKVCSGLPGQSQRAVPALKDAFSFLENEIQCNEKRTLPGSAMGHHLPSD